MNLQLQLRAVSLFVFTFSFCFSQAQLGTSFFAAKVMLRNGQQLNGYIKGDVVNKMNYRIQFKDSLSIKNTTEYDTSNVAGFSLSNGEEYELLHYKLDESADSMAVLAGFILKGKVSLYKFYHKAKLVYLLKNNDRVYALQDDELNSQWSAEYTRHYYKNRIDSAFNHDARFIEPINSCNFKEKELVAIVNKYNGNNGTVSKMIEVKNGNNGFINLGIHYGYKSSIEEELQLHIGYRRFFPRFNKGTSLNIGLNYFKGKISSDYTTYYSHYNSFDLVTLPLTLQQNILNGKIRPYLFLGMNFGYKKEADEYGTSLETIGDRQNFGMSFIGGAGIEISIYSGLYLKGEYRYDYYSHPLLFGLGYVFATGKKN